MKIIGLLESGEKELVKKLDLLSKNINLAKNLTQNSLKLHLDIILPTFAYKRKVEPTFSFEVSLKYILSYLANQIDVLQIHIMGEETEEKEALKMIKDSLLGRYMFRSEVYVHNNNLLEKDNAIYRWFNLGEKIQVREETKALVMTVLAGRAGQVKNEDLSRDFELKNNKVEITFDGGWHLSDTVKNIHNHFVVNTDFWTKLDELTNLDS